MSSYTNHGKTTSAKTKQWAKINIDRKRSSYIEKNCFEKSHNYCSRTEYSSWRPCFHKTVLRVLHEFNIHGRVAIATPLITETNTQMRNRWCRDHETWTSDNWKHARDTVRWVVLHHSSLHQEEFTFGKYPRNPTIRNAWFGSNSETKRRFCDGFGTHIEVQYSVGPIITLHGRITAREYMDRLGNQVHHVIKNLFPNNDAVF
jgi:hypothetical protein